jgi:hypothetical protein
MKDSGIVAVTTYLQQEFPSATITVVESKGLDTHLFRIDLEDGTSPYDVLVWNELLTDADIPRKLTLWNVSHLIRVAIGTVEINLLGPSIRRRE